MAIFKYKAIYKNGDEKSGIVSANNTYEAYHKICNKKLLPINLSRIYKVSSKIDIEEILMFFLHIDFQLKCGVKINEAIDSFIDSHTNNVLNVKLLEISESLKSGKSLGESFESSIFDPTIIGLINAAEKTGNISEIITNILSFFKLKTTWKRKVKSILAYPLFITFSAIIIMWFCIVFLGPQVIYFTQNYSDKNIPLLTNIAVDFLPYVFAICIGLLCIFLILAIIFSISNRWKKTLYNSLLKIPKIGCILKTVAIWQFCKILQISLTAHLDFINAMKLSINSIHYETLKEDFINIKTKILCGYKIFEAFSESKYIPSNIITAIYVGEEGNNLPETLLHISDELYKDTISKLEMLGKSLSIELTLITGGIFIFILYSLFYPLYSYVEIVE